MASNDSLYVTIRPIIQAGVRVSVVLNVIAFCQLYMCACTNVLISVLVQVFVCVRVPLYLNFNVNSKVLQMKIAKVSFLFCTLLPQSVCL